MGRRLGVMGGTFDPIHYGHLLTAEEARWKFDLDEVVFIPAGIPWMKGHEVVAPSEHRYLMAVVATSSNRRFSVSRIEIDRPGPTHTVDTLRRIMEERGEDADLHFITGADAVLELPDWKDPDEVLRLATVVAATRPGYDLTQFQEGGARSHPRLIVMPIPALAISSTDLRERVRDGRPIDYLVPEGVRAYIEKSGLYL